MAPARPARPARPGEAHAASTASPARGSGTPNRPRHGHTPGSARRTQIDARKAGPAAFAAQSRPGSCRRPTARTAAGVARLNSGRLSPPTPGAAPRPATRPAPGSGSPRRRPCCCPRASWQQCTMILASFHRGLDALVLEQITGHATLRLALHPEPALVGCNRRNACHCSLSSLRACHAPRMSRPRGAGCQCGETRQRENVKDGRQ